GVFKTTDGGESWTALNFGLTTPRVWSLALDPSNPSRLYAGSVGGGVYVLEPLSRCGDAPRSDCKMQIPPQRASPAGRPDAEQWRPADLELGERPADSWGGILRSHADDGLRAVP